LRRCPDLLYSAFQLLTTPFAWVRPIIIGTWIEIPRSRAEENPMINCAELATEADEQSRQSEVALTATLLELLTVAQSKVELDRKAAQAYLSRATALLTASLERERGPKAESEFRD